MTNYYISDTGSDGAAGTSLATAWATVAPWNTLVAGAGVATNSTLTLIGSLSFTTSLNLPTNAVTVTGTSSDTKPTVTVTAGQIGILMADACDGHLVRWINFTGGTTQVNYGTNAINSIVRECTFTAWTVHAIDGAGGTSMNGNKVQSCYGHDGQGDFFTTGDGSGWTCEYNHAENVTEDAGTPGTCDGFSFHDASAHKNVVRYNYIKNIAPGTGKAGISCGSQGPVSNLGGSYVEAYGNIIINCGNHGIACLPVGGNLRNDLGQLIAYNNIIITTTASTVAVGGIDVYGDCVAPIIFNNAVYNRLSHSRSGANDTNRNPSYRLDCSATGGQPIFFNNISILSDVTNELHWAGTMNFQLAMLATAGGDFGTCMNNNSYYPASTDGYFPLNGSALSFAAMQASAPGIEDNSMEALPKTQSTSPTTAQDFFLDSSSPLVAAGGGDMTAYTTTDMFGLTRSGKWTIGPHRESLLKITDVTTITRQAVLK